MKLNSFRLLIFIFLTLNAFTRISANDVEYISSEEFLEKFPSFYDELKFSYHEMTEEAGVMKILTFGEDTSIFIGARNRIYKVSPTMSKFKSSEDLRNGIFSDPIVPIPSHFYQRRGQTYYVRQTVNLSLDTCLSYFERRQASRTNVDFTGVSSRELPRSAHNSSLIRFGRDLEEFVCANNTFVRGIEKIRLQNGTEVLWLCGTFASFPKAFLMDPISLKVLDRNFSDTNLPTCARWPDEPMATKVLSDNSTLFLATGWGLYRPTTDEPDAAFNDSTMLYSDWRMLWNGLHWPTRMAMVLSSDVRFIAQVYETEHYLYFFGHEANPQYSYVNSLTRQSDQSFMLRICKNDTGYRYTADQDATQIRKNRRNLKELTELWVTRFSLPLNSDETAFSYSSKAWNDTYRFPTKHFTSAIKFPFGCYLKRYDGAQSLNSFWGEQNIIYFNRVADVLLNFNWTDELSETLKSSTDSLSNGYEEEYSGYEVRKKFFNPNAHVYNSMIGAFASNVGSLHGQGFRPAGAVCQFQVSEWKMDHLLRERQPPPPEALFKLNLQYKDLGGDDPYAQNVAKNARQYTRSTTDIQKAFPDNPVTNLTAREEFLALYGSFKDNFYSKGHVWLQGLNPPHRPGIDVMSVPTFDRRNLTFLDDAGKCGKCLDAEAIRSMTDDQFENLMNFSSTAWPTDWFSYLTKYYDAFFHLNPMSVAGDNASFVMDNVEFSKMIVLRQNFTAYNFTDDSSTALEAPLTYALLISTEGDVYRVVMCDLVSFPIRKTKCEMRNTDQPYLTVHSMAMRLNENQAHKLRQIRVSSLLSIWHMTRAEDEGQWRRLNPQAPLLKDAMFDESSKVLYLMTAGRVVRLNMQPEELCATYKTCVSCASDPLCAWEFLSFFPVMNGTCATYDNKNSTAARVQDVLGRGQMCQNFIPKVKEWTVKAVCSPESTILLKCSYKSLFRGSIIWRVGNQSNLRDVDFEEGSEDPGPDGDLIVRNILRNSVFYECVGVGFDNVEETVSLNRYKVIQIDPSNQTDIDRCICPVIRHSANRSDFPECQMDGSSSTATIESKTPIKLEGP